MIACLTAFQPLLPLLSCTSLFLTRRSFERSLQYSPLQYSPLQNVPLQNVPLKKMLLSRKYVLFRSTYLLEVRPF